MNCNSDNCVVSQNCAISLAIRKVWPFADVFTNGIYPNLTLPSDKIDLPRSAAIFIKVFDMAMPEHRLEMKPFYFDIEVTESMLPKWWEAAIKETETLELV